MIIYYLTDSNIIRNVDYCDGSKKRNLLDIYLPYNCNTKTNTRTPVIIFVSGGAWIIGYKLWSALVGRGLSQLGKYDHHYYHYHHYHHHYYHHYYIRCNMCCT